MTTSYCAYRVGLIQGSLTGFDAEISKHPIDLRTLRAMPEEIVARKATNTPFLAFYIEPV